MDVLGKARRLESTIAAKLDEAAKAFVRSRPREPLEIVLAILEAVDQRIEQAVTRVEESISTAQRASGGMPIEGRAGLVQRLAAAIAGIEQIVDLMNPTIERAKHGADGNGASTRAIQASFAPPAWRRGRRWRRITAPTNGSAARLTAISPRVTALRIVLGLLRCSKRSP
jgi:hypothetical protein